MGNLTMDNSDKVALDAKRWFFGGLVAAISFALFLVWVDYFLTHSQSEKRKAQIIRELREAQAAVGTGDIDPRSLPLLLRN